MASPVPVLRAPVPGRGPRKPALGLSIPPSPNARPVVNGTSEGQPGAGRPMPPRLQLATPMGSNTTPQEGGRPRLQLATPMGSSRTPQGLPPLQISTGLSANSSDASANSRTGSFGENQANGSAASYQNGSGFSSTLQEPGQATDPISAISQGGSEGGSAMQRGASSQPMPDLEALSLEKGRPLDVEDLDDMGWRAASKNKLIEELGSLGEGAGGAVTRCKLKGGKTVFALKIITTNPDPDVKKQIVRELSFNKNCASDHICRYWGAFVDDDGTISIAMEFCEGGSLDAVYREVKKLGGRTGEKVLGKVAEGVLNGLTYLHSHRIIHRDIKPSNILLCRNGQVKLCDFGVSGEFGTKGDANTFIGTSYYMAPERITGQSYTITSDVWSLGVTLLEVAQHRFPFPADGTEMNPRAGLIDLLTYIVRQPIPTLKDEPEAGIKWSENFKYFIECCLEKECPRRATPWRMLEHPWMVEMKSKKVNMAHFLKQVWDWKD
ncbi:Protein kinase C signaling pathway involved MAPKK protein [Didymella pomorum]|uniref:Protein kinase C signaling pathway involved MAPKK protein n=1 Tax=Didymella pomorum TaxID=749634 RepID=A0A9W8Z978_9PLEO|nr:Protein kinase C signaling pathway involved MAPKK protein [Didymella pomorum]